MENFRDVKRDVTAPVLRDNLDIAHQHLKETLDASGHPPTTDSNALRDISKILSVTDVAGHSGSTTSNLSAFSSPITWCKACLRSNSNDIHFDIAEILDAVVNN
jgi:AP-3 complex subunit mu